MAATDEFTAGEGSRNTELLRKGGFSGEEISEWSRDQRRRMKEAGVTLTQEDAYFGLDATHYRNPEYLAEEDARRIVRRTAPAPRPAPPPPSPLSLETLGAPSAPEPAALTPSTDDPHFRVAQGFVESLQAGYQSSVIGLTQRRKLPDLVLPEKADGGEHLGAMLGMLTGDSVPMVAGALAGGALGTAIRPGAGTATLGGAGALMLPAMLRESLMQAYTNGDIRGAKDLADRTAAIAIEGLKSGTIGATMGGMGHIAGRVAAPYVSPFTKFWVEGWGQLTGATVMSELIEGHIPKPGDFIKYGVVVAVLGSSVAMSKVAAQGLRDVYTKTGIRPQQVAKDMKKDPTIAKDLLDPKKDLPDAYQSMRDDVPPSF